MADVHSQEVRSYNMSRIRGKNTKPEILVRKFLYSHGLRYRLHSKSIPGKPDILISKYKTIIDIRGCFWHGHKNCRFGDSVKTKSPQIAQKIELAKVRDIRNEEKWKGAGWNIIIVWDSCELEARKIHSPKRERVLKDILQKILLKSDSSN